jgi:cytoskeletal protein CcmA (bactofilin family)
MAITRVQQTQISGSVSFSLPSVDGSNLGGKSSLLEDLNALRSLVKEIKGADHWYDQTSQDLKKVYSAMHAQGTNYVDAAFQGAISAVGDADLNGKLDVAGQVDLAAASVATSIRGTLSVAEAATMSSTLSVAGDLTGSAGFRLSGAADLNGALDVAGQVDLAASGVATSVRGTLSVAEKADFAGIVDIATTLSASAIKIDGDTAQRLYIVDADGSIKDEANLVYDASNLIVKASGLKMQDSLARQKFLVDASGNMDVKGNTVLSGSLKISADTVPGRVYIVGADGEVSDSSALNYSMMGGFQVTGAATVSNGLTVNGSAAIFRSGATASSVAIDGDQVNRLYVVGTDGTITDSANMQFASSELSVTGSLAVVGMMGARQFTVAMASGDVTMAGDLTVSGNDIKSSSATALTLSGSDVEVVGDLKVTGNDIKASDSAIALSLLGGGDVEVKGDLKVSGNDIKASDGAVAMSLLGSGDVQIARDLFVERNLHVKGQTTYIDTDNLKVKDAIIHIATGSASAASRGLVLHGGDQGLGADLGIGAKASGYEFVFAKGIDDQFVDSTNTEIFSTASLATAWMGGVKLGGKEGTLSGSLTASAAGIELSTGRELLASATGDLKLASNGNAAIVFAASSEVPDTSFIATTVVGMLNELRIDLDAASTGGNLVKNVYAGAALSSGALALSHAPSAAQPKLLDVYLNGVLLEIVASSDLTKDVWFDGSASAIKFNSSLGIEDDDKITVIVRG